MKIQGKRGGGGNEKQEARKRLGKPVYCIQPALHVAFVHSSTPITCSKVTPDTMGIYTMRTGYQSASASSISLFCPALSSAEHSAPAAPAAADDETETKAPEDADVGRLHRLMLPPCESTSQKDTTPHTNMTMVLLSARRMT